MPAQFDATRWFAMTVLIAGLCFQSYAQVADKPSLLIETGRHTAPITAISATKDGSLLATASDDKSIRIWDAAGRQIQVIRPPVGSRANDSIFSVALSPDGSQIAFQYSKPEKVEESGRFVTIFPVQVLNLKSQKIFSIETIRGAVQLSFSPDGRYLAWISAFGSKSDVSIGVYRTTDWALYALMNRGGDRSGLGTVQTSLAFAPDGRRIVVTLGSQTEVLLLNGADYGNEGLYDVSKCLVDDKICWTKAFMDAGKRRLTTEKILKPAHGKQPFGVKWSPNEKWIAYGYMDSPSVTLISTATWTQNELAAPSLMSAYLNGPKTMCRLTWSLDSKRLLSSGTMGSKLLGPTVIRSWSIATKPTSEDVDLTTRSDKKLAVEGMIATSRGYAFIASNSLDGYSLAFFEDHEVRLLKPTSGLRGNSSVENTLDGLKVFFSYPEPGSILGTTYSFDVLNRELKPEPKELPHSFYHIDTAPGMDNSALLSDVPVLNGVRLEIDSRSRSFTFAADGQTLLLGTSYYLYRFDRTGSTLWRLPIPAAALGMNVSRDGKLLLVILDDGTLRWYRLLDGKELAAFYALNDRQSWAMWTPDGYFDTSHNGNVILNIGTVKPDGFIVAEPVSLSSPMHRPDKINDALTKILSLSEAIGIPSRQ